NETLAPFHFPWSRSQVVLTQSGPALKKPGESHNLQCATSGFALNSYWMGWVRQEPGKGLDWIAYYYGESSTKYYASSVQGRLTASKDSTNFYLQMTNLKAEDTAMYYCARATVKGSCSELRQKPSLQ
uniref:Ig-like domain-containing protein n=1 Tax=Pelusios castaneus TaxID=367368 RepID=A0A8C8RZ30_9SAUR